MEVGMGSSARLFPEYDQTLVHVDEFNERWPFSVQLMNVPPVDLTCILE